MITVLGDSVGVRPRGRSPRRHDDSWGIGFPLAIHATLGVGAAYLMQGPLDVVLAAGLPGARTTIRWLVWMTALAAPLFALLKALMTSLLVWSVATLAGEEAPYRPVMVVALYAELLLAAAAFVAPCVLAIRGLPPRPTLASLVVPTGVDALFHDLPALGRVIAGYVSPFQLAWFVVLGMVLPRVAGVRPCSAWAGAALVWLSSVMLAVARWAVLS